MDSINIIVAGAFGKMGQEVCSMIEREERFQLVAIVDPKGREKANIPVYTNPEDAFKNVQADVFIDFTNPKVVFDNVRLSLRHGVRPVVGTTGLSEAQIRVLRSICDEMGLGAIIAPNFAIGAVLMMKFSQMAARYLPHVEIIEFHHDQKLDAPSGTSLKTAEMISHVRASVAQGSPNEKELIHGARGGDFDGLRIHSVRLPGYVAHQEVIFGGEGQVLTIRHDSINRTSFMPGVKLAIEQVMKLKQLVYGLEHLIE